MKVRSTQIRTPQATGSTFIINIATIMIGINTIENFFQILNTFSENIRVDNNEAEINRGVKTKNGISSSKTQELQV
jgi:hypothetical protein